MSAAEPKPPTVRAAWVESPLQILNAVEFAAETGEPLRIYPRDAVRQLEATIAAIELQLPVGVEFAPPLRTIFGLPPSARAKLLVGDIYSGQFRAYFALRSSRDLVIVDDGTSTLHLASTLANRHKRLSRMSKRESPVMKLLGLRLRQKISRVARKGRVAIFTVYEETQHVTGLSALGYEVMKNSHRWLADVSLGGVRIESARVILGTSLVATGQIRAEPYLDWVRDISRRGSALYHPHRREDAETIEAVAAIPGVRVIRSRVPVELFLAGRATVKEIYTLPTSAVRVLSGVLPSAQVSMSSVPIEWWVPEGRPELRAVLGDLASMEGAGDGER